MRYKPGEFFSISHKSVDRSRFRQLSAYAQAAYYAFNRVYNGHNNGNLVMSSRGMGELINCSFNKAAGAIEELVTANIIEVTCDFRFGPARKSTSRTYRLIEHKCDVTGMRAGAASNRPQKKVILSARSVQR